MFFPTKATGILGINARNLLYVARHNSPSAKKFADDKLFTKNFLGSRGIGIAKLHFVIRNQKELFAFRPENLPNEFVIKPNRGYGGEGIIVVTGRKADRFVTIGGERLTWEQLRLHLVSILEGRYAISGIHDFALIEERLFPHACFKNFCDTGLPDIRVIVFNQVPVIAMLRLPTVESEGKANLHLGALGIGLDLGTGRATAAIYKNKYMKKLPGGELVNTLILPEWSEMLLTASRLQNLTKIGYLAVDLVLTTTGVKVLEVNARAGLSVQLANRVLLRSRLEKVSDLKITTPEQGVEIARTLFSTPKTLGVKSVTKTVLGLFEPLTILTPRGESSVLAKIDPHAPENLVDQKFFAGENPVDIILRGKRFKISVTPADLSNQEYKLILSGKALVDFWIDSNFKSTLLISPETTPQAKKTESILAKIDREVCRLDQELKLLSYLRPLNLSAERALFFQNPTRSPNFIYRPLEIPIPEFLQRLKKIPRVLEHPLMPIYTAKMRELECKLNLLRAVGSAEFSAHSRKLFGQVDARLREKALRFLRATPLQPDESKFLTAKEAVKFFRENLKRHGLVNWKIKLSPEVAVRMQVTKHHTILLQENAQFTHNQVQALNAHEIETHVFRFENGHRQKYQIFERGTASYLTTEEGLAIYNQRRLGLALGTKAIIPALNVIAIQLAQTLPFAELFQTLKKEYTLTDEETWQICVKVKRGLTDTSRLGAFTKDLVYLKGYEQVSHFLGERPHSEKLQQLYVGKIGLDDWSCVQPFMAPAKFLPKANS